ncbi:Inner membrane metabolite transport protein YdjE [Tautonia plasticadhaerens]|uniref:Inner membrane metabolite transport protein YdjE n=2 Tax=Tautonia plasticadhaerens TaxID=2527974 RepID=A0A518H363_9BACT|nr:MFS transporter [Tautonia plasticadhaerens]QDV35260.1 Inner membrane metabolite transport protein YdjE [Tautonia plasticadhaerens]
MMHAEPPGDAALDDGKGPWHRGLTRYHWFVLAVAALGWLFDTMDQQLFNLARKPAMEDLLGTGDANRVNFYGTVATSIFIVGWAVGGLFFGILGDKIGRAKTMLLTILIYSIFTGLSAFSFTVWDFAFYRFLTGLGVGGEFAVGVALVAEVMPDHARARALGWLQALSAVGNMTAAMIAITLGSIADTGMDSWRIMFLIGTLPALLAIVIRMKLKEPERWQKAAQVKEADPMAADDAIGGAEVEAGPKLGSLAELFGDPRWRRNTIVGMLLAFSGVVGLWGIGFFSFDLIRDVFADAARQMAIDSGLEDEAAISAFAGKKLTQWTGYVSLVQNAGAFFGIYAFSVITERIGRKPTFAIAFLLAMFSTAFTFLFLGRIAGFYDVYWMIPIMGFCQIALFGGYAIYFPELFPTRLRSTGTSFCYNVGRLVAATGPLALGGLITVFAEYGETDTSLPLRYAGVTMCAAFLIGLCALPFAPETRDQPLPE